MNKRRILLSLLVVLVFVAIIKVLPNFLEIYSEWVSFLNPKIISNTQEKWGAKSNDFLLKKMKSSMFIQSVPAARILLGRKDKNLIREFIKLLDSPDKGMVLTAIEALGLIGDEKAAPSVAKLLKNNRDENIHYEVMLALARMRYEPILSDVIKMSKSDKRGDRHLSIGMLEGFNNQETIAILHRIAEKDSERTNRDAAERALFNLKQTNGL